MTTLTLIENLIIATIILLLLAIAIPLFRSTSRKANGPHPIDNYNVKCLFETNGVKVYSFRDNGQRIYFTDVRERTEWKTNEKTASKHQVEMAGE